MEQRANIKFCFKLGKKFAEIYELIWKVYGDDWWVILKFTRGLHEFKEAVII